MLQAWKAWVTEQPWLAPVEECVLRTHCRIAVVKVRLGLVSNSEQEAPSLLRAQVAFEVIG